jgi:hypothetical protein
VYAHAQQWSLLLAIKKTLMKLYDVCTRKFYEKDGEKKVKWYRAGMMKTTDKGSTYVRLFNQPQTDFFVFEKEEPQTLPEIQIEK